MAYICEGSIVRYGKAEAKVIGVDYKSKLATIQIKNFYLVRDLRELQLVSYKEV